MLASQLIQNLFILPLCTADVALILISTSSPTLTVFVAAALLPVRTPDLVPALEAVSTLGRAIVT